MLFRSGEESVTKYLSYNGIFTNKQIIDRLKLEIEMQEKYNTSYFPIFDLKTNELIGCCGLRLSNIDDNSYELGIHLRSKFWNKGIAFEAASEIIKYGFNTLKATKIFVGHHPNNLNSKKVIDKLGFKYYKDIYYEPTKIYHPFYIYSK